nr:hypothetical protein [Variovorax paradoxus]
MLTHLDFDHAGGLDDIPQVQVHMMQREREAAEPQRTWLDRQRFRPQQWSSGRATRVGRSMRRARAVPPGKVSSACAACADSRPRSSWCRCRVIPSAMQAWRAATAPRRRATATPSRA